MAAPSASRAPAAGDAADETPVAPRAGTRPPPVVFRDRFGFAELLAAGRVRPLPLEPDRFAGLFFFELEPGTPAITPHESHT